MEKLQLHKCDAEIVRSALLGQHITVAILLASLQTFVKPVAESVAGLTITASTKVFM